MGLLTRLFSKVHIAVHIEETECHILVQVVSGNKVKFQETKKFFIEKNVFSDTMNKYLLKWQSRYNLVYVSTLLSGLNQGATETCTKNQLVKIGVPISNVEVRCINNSWQTYADIEDIAYTRKLFDICGLDLLYSTFSLMYFHFKKDIRSGTLYILYRKSSISLVIYKNSSVIFSAYFVLHKEDENMFEDAVAHIEEDEDTDDDIVMSNGKDKNDEDLMFFEDDELELDDLEDSTPTPKKEPKKEEPKKEIKKEQPKQIIPKTQNVELNTIKSERLFNIVKDSLDEFYKNSIYSSEFIGKIVFADSVGLSKDVIAYINEELLIEIEHQIVSIPDMLVNISKEEVGK